MRALLVISALAVVVLLTGCDPGGLRRVRVRLPQSPDASGTLTVHQADVEDALLVLDTVVVPLGFEPTQNQGTIGYIRVYTLERPPVTVEGRDYPRDVHIRVRKMPNGIEAAFGEFGFLASTPEPAVRAFKDARAAFVSKYGSRNVKTKTFGSANQALEATADPPSS